MTLALPIKDGAAWLSPSLEEIDEFVRRFSRSCEVIVVDDGSGDETRELLESLRKERDYLVVVTHAQNRGKGAALKTAVAVSSGEFVLTMDADATYSVEDVTLFLEQLEAGNDAVLGNRRDPRARFVLHPVHFPYIGFRHAVGWLFAVTVRFVLRVKVRDPQCGIKGYRGDVARRIFPLVKEDRFAFDAELLALLHLFGHRIAELPVLYYYRQQQSSVRLLRDGLRMGLALLRIRRRMRHMSGTSVLSHHDRAKTSPPSAPRN